ncbi:unnamed protein product [Arabis nemorensis]|uniref:Uncharacterized protein n=1 Tax=Arabis nemorensis TaxID=586526 RepID=A0A565B152_9BRAS|nr:unnamed protein product [Arabis nemorensis]
MVLSPESNTGNLTRPAYPNALDALDEVSDEIAVFPARWHSLIARSSRRGFHAVRRSLLAMSRDDSVRRGRWTYIATRRRRRNCTVDVTSEAEKLGSRGGVDVGVARRTVMRSAREKPALRGGDNDDIMR